MAFLVGYSVFVCKTAEMYEFSHVPQSVYIQNLSVFFLILFCVHAYFAKSFQIKKSKVYYPVFGLLIWSFLSLFWSTNVPEGLFVWLNWMAGGIIFFVVYNVIKDKKDIQLFLYFFLIPNLFILVIAISQLLEKGLHNFYPQFISPSVTFGNKNMMVDVFVTILPATLILLLNENRKKISLFFVVVVQVLGVCMVFLTDTRAGMLALFTQTVIGFAFVYFFRKKQTEAIQKTNGRWVILGALIFSFALSLVIIDARNQHIQKTGVGQPFDFEHVKNRVTTIFTTKSSDEWALKQGNEDKQTNVISDSRTMRLVTWLNTFGMFLNKPITGFGLYNWQIHYGEYRTIYLNDPVYRPGVGLYQVHNDYLQLLADLGLVGAAFVLGILYFNLKSFVLVIRKKDYRDFYTIGLGLVGLHVVATFSFPFERAVPVLLFFVFTAFLTFYLDVCENKTENHVRKIKYQWSLGGAVFFTVLLICLNALQDRRYTAETEFKAANDQYALGNFELAVQHCERALNANPYRPQTYLLLGYAYVNLNKLKEAEETLLIGLRYYPNELNTLLQLGTTYTKMTLEAFAKHGKESPEVTALLDKANFWFDKTLKIRGDFHIIYYNRGVLNGQRSRFAKYANDMDKYQQYRKLAIENYELSIHYKGDYVDGLLALARSYNEENNHEMALSKASKAVDVLVGNYDKSEALLISLEDRGVSKVSREFFDMSKQRRRNRQLLISFIDEPLKIMKNYYGAIKIDFEMYLKVLFYEEKLYLAKEVEVTEQFLYAQEVLNHNLGKKDNDSKMYEALEKEYNSRKQDLDRFKIEKHLAMVMILSNMSDVYNAMKNYDMALKHLAHVINLGGTYPEGLNQAQSMMLTRLVKIAHIKTAEILCVLSSVNWAGQELDLVKFKELSPMIEQHLNKAAVKAGDPLHEQFVSVYNKYNIIKSVALKHQ